MNYTDLMIDLETLGNGPGCAIAQIGLAAFGLEGKPNTDLIRVNPQSCIDAGLRMDWSTIKWWLGQEARAQYAVFFPNESVSLRAAMVRLLELKATLPNLQRVWSHGATFDLPIITYCAVAADVELPWDFRMHRDTRTLLELCPDVKRIKPERPHEADSDALAQALTIQRVMQLFPQVYGGK